MSLRKYIYFFNICLQLCNNLIQNQYKIIIILIKANLYFLFVKESTTSIYYCRANSEHPFKKFFGNSLGTSWSTAKLAFIMILEKQWRVVPIFWPIVYIFIYILMMMKMFPVVISFTQYLWNLWNVNETLDSQIVFYTISQYSFFMTILRLKI